MACYGEVEASDNGSVEFNYLCVFSGFGAIRCRVQSEIEFPLILDLLLYFFTTVYQDMVGTPGGHDIMQAVVIFSMPASLLKV